GDCSTLEPFAITITPTAEIDGGAGTACDEFELPAITGTNLAGDEAYYTEMNGGGTVYNAGDLIDMSQTLYIYGDDNGCPSEAEFIVTIVETPSIDPNSGAACDSLQLPAITGVGTAGAIYNTAADGSGTTYIAGEFIDFSTTLYMIVAAGDCSTLESFDVTITPTAEIDGGAGTACDEFELPEITGTNLAGDEAYYTEMNGGGTVYNAGDLIDMSQTLYIYGDDNGCPSEAEFVVTIVETPSIDPNSGSACDSLQLPAITGVGTAGAFYFTEMDGAGTQYAEGDWISTSTTLYMYVAAGACSTEEPFAITITPTAEIDGGAGTACDEFELPAITGTNLAGDEAYYTEMNGGGTVYNAGDFIDMSQTLYIYGDDNGCPSEAEFVVTIVETPSIDPNSGAACDSLQLPAITGVGTTGAFYFTEMDGAGTQYAEGDWISTSTTLYMYVAAGACSTEEPFDVTITPTAEIDGGAGTACDEFELPEITGTNLAGDEAYYTEMNGGGTVYNAGDLIDMSQTLYIYGDDNGCPSEAEFVVTIVETPSIDPNSGAACDSLQLPAITGVGTAGAFYFTEMGGAGTQYAEGDWISTSTTLYMYVAAGACSTEEPFVITITPTAEIDGGAGTACDEFELPAITGTNLAGDEAYYTEMNGGGTVYNAGDLVDMSQTLYIYGDDNGCPSEAEFVVTIVETPSIDPNSGSACDSLQLPAITGVGTAGAFYFTEMDGAGTQYAEGDWISTSTTLYMYVAAGACSTEEPFAITITPTAEIDGGAGTACDEFELPEITGTNLAGDEAYYTEMNGSGTVYNAGDLVDMSQTLYIYGDDNGCPSEAEFVVTIVETPSIDPNSGAACDSLQLPAITGVGTTGAFYFTEMNGGGTQYAEGDWISTSTTLYMYVAAGSCSTEEPFAITITPTAEIDGGAGTACDEFELPAITGTNLAGDEAYYTEMNGGGTVYNAGDLVDMSQTLYIYGDDNGCPSEAEFVVTIVETPSIDPNSGAACDSLQLPAITGVGVTGAFYFTEMGGAGTQYAEGDWISTSTTLYMYVAAGACSTEEPFAITITPTAELDGGAGTACDEFELPEITGTNLAGDEAYYTEMNGGGTVYNAGDFIDMSQTLYIYGDDNGCPSEAEFVVTIVETPSIDPNSGAACDSLQLPAITGVGVTGAFYFTEMGGAGTQYTEGDWISTSTTLYMYVAAGACSTEEPFAITITPTAEIDGGAGTACDEFELPAITGTNLAGDEAYYTEMNGGGTVYNAGDLVDMSQTLYIYGDDNGCPSEAEFVVTIVETPSIDPNSGAACDSLQLPAITGVGTTGAFYFTEMGGAGTQYAEGDWISTSTTLYMYVAAGACSTEEPFAITITPTAEIDGGAGTACDEFELPAITGTNLAGDEAYYTEMNGGGTVYNAGDLVDMSQTLYIYGDDNGCPSEAEFVVTIVETPSIDPNSGAACDSLQLPAITGVGVTGAFYFTEMGGAGTQYAEGDWISTSTTLYMYVAAGACSTEEPFAITITPTAEIDGGAGTACDEFELPAITGTNLAGDEAYYTEMNGSGTVYNAGDLVDMSQTLYIYGDDNGCPSEAEFVVTIVETPSIDPNS
ncbi:hypothetical protein, partial [Portibacter lacus]|uniref:hypothetical protein n=1 Tax=Portibacter lacus TaxID=1099794 RepID=UPI001F372257